MNQSELIKKAQAAYQHHKSLVQKLKKKTPPQLDELFQELHDEAFNHVNCLDCANCCRSLGPRITDRDIERLSKGLKMKPSAFTEKHLRIDEDGDYVFKNMPCPFLGADNYCAVYENRPKACRDYPHTNSRKMVGLLNLALKNTSTCPAVFEILEELRTRTN